MSQWDLEALHARIRHPGRERYPAGSPDDAEVARYHALLGRTLERRRSLSRNTVLVLGMTPELRRLAIALDCNVITIDSSPLAIETYRDWLSPSERRHERVLQGDWLEVPALLDGPVDAVLGDGVFGNLQTLAAHRALLRALAAWLAPEGALIMRNILIPDPFPLVEHAAERLVQAFREGFLDEFEFGFAMRIWGSFAQAYDNDTLLLDNACVYTRYDQWLADKRLTPSEHALIRRYYFAGKNLVPPQSVLASLLRDAGFAVEWQALAGRAWYAYYPIHCCERHVP